MLASSIPANFQLPFGNSASGTYIRAIPVASQIGITAGAASLTDGFPPVCFADPLAGGVPPSGADFNGILNEITANIRWWGAGGYPKRDATFSAAIGGYPNGAILQSADNTGYWISTADNNTSNPDADGANWLPAWFTGMTGVAITSADVTLTLTQYARPLINLTGVLTGNRSLILPAIVGEWTVINGTTGAYTVTVKTAAGTGVPVLQGALTRVVGNGTNVYTETALSSNILNALKVSIASAVTPDIFAAAANTIDYSGTANCTGFVAAPHAGMTRTLICSAACQFTAGANLLIEGIVSGVTITLGANAIVDVIALSTTQFKMTYSVSGTFTAGLGGASGSPGLPGSQYLVSNGRCFLHFPSPNNQIVVTNDGTSNFNINNIPVQAQPFTIGYYQSPIVDATSGPSAGYAYAQFSSAGVLNFVWNHYTGTNTWSTTGAKAIAFSDAMYSMN